MLSIEVQELLKILVGNCTVLKRLKAAKRESKRCFLELSLRQFMLRLPHKINSFDVL